ncbi:glycosyl hydrolases family 17 domain-containing protein [Sarocladium implicatum]|nr:glycosyl hydrolases family 17 domain-containing protein [Sarocladium implicatum]
MPSSTKMMAVAAAASTASAAAFQGFNYGATYADGRLRVQSDFESLFEAAQGLDGTDGKFTSARLYTMIQGNTGNEPISAIPAAIKTKTSILFGLWASAGQDNFNNEIDALQKTIDQYCDQLDGLVAGISVGSEDLYRDSPIGQEAGENPGAGPKVLAGYIKQVRETIKGSCLKDAPIGHVDTWTAYVNQTNQPLIEACDWLGMDAYPYFENTKPNAIDEGKSLFEQALANTKGAAGEREVWITETGWPTSGKKSGAAVANTKNARTYWEEVGCSLFGNVNTWWYTLMDSNSDGPITDETPSFGVVGDDLSKPKYNLSCKNVDTKKPSASSSSKPEATSSKPESTATKGGNGGSGSGSDDKDKDNVSTKAESTANAQETKTEAESTDTADAAESTHHAGAIVTPPAGKTTVSTVHAPAATPTGGNSGSDSGSGSNGNDAPSGNDNQDGGDDSPDTTDSGSNKQLKGSFGAVIIALGLTFFAL